MLHHYCLLNTLKHPSCPHEIKVLCLFFYAYWDCTCLSIRLHWWARLIGINMTNTLTAVCRFSVSMVLWCISQPEPAGLCAVYRHISSILAAIWKLAAPPECASICFCTLLVPTDDEWCFHWQSVNVVACYALRLSPSWLEKKKTYTGGN